MKKDKKNKELDELSLLYSSMSRITSIFIWAVYMRKFITEIIGAILGTIWASTLLIYIFTENKFYLKLFVGLIAIGLIFYFILMLLESIGKRKREKYFESLDMANFETPPLNDINIKFFSEEEPIKYLVTDKNDPMYSKIMFLYPMYGRLNPNKTVTFFKKNQIEPITNINLKN